MSKQRHAVVPAVYLVLQKHEQILLSLRAGTGYADGYYTLPSGHLEPRETLLQALIREAQEEIDIQIEPQDIELVHVLHRPFANDAARIDFFFTAKKWLGEPRNAEPHKCQEIRWTTLKEMHDLPLVAHLKPVFEEISKKTLYSHSDLS